MQVWVIYALLSAVFAALVAIFGKMGLKNIDSTLATTVRSVIMAAFLVLVSLSLKKTALLNTIEGKALLFIVLSGIAGAISWLFYFYAIKEGSASTASAIDRLSIVFVFILAVIFLGEKFTWGAALGAVLIVLGALFMSKIITFQSLISFFINK
ncbi:MAG: bacterial/archaeal transporter family protein [Patescibacteria group bacterium]|nr:bacterial/archaeal transporter family protein [Patescibacteria group bacterium]MDQ5970267.1 bacterial/archaeal transporter family protein [Patescibacteria group bacterium]